MEEQVSHNKFSEASDGMAFTTLSEERRKVIRRGLSPAASVTIQGNIWTNMMRIRLSRQVTRKGPAS